MATRLFHTLALWSRGRVAAGSDTLHTHKHTHTHTHVCIDKIYYLIACVVPRV
jgi:hypothetical protein